eukprot:8958-Heterococcus_DN1.PRE.3
MDTAQYLKVQCRCLLKHCAAQAKIKHSITLTHRSALAYRLAHSAKRYYHAATTASTHYTAYCDLQSDTDDTQSSSHNELEYDST